MLYPIYPHTRVTQLTTSNYGLHGSYTSSITHRAERDSRNNRIR